jgi:hypothetical protein
LVEGTVRGHLRNSQNRTLIQSRNRFVPGRDRCTASSGGRAGNR